VAPRRDVRSAVRYAPRSICRPRRVGREDVRKASALPPRFCPGAGVWSGLGPGLTSESADARLRLSC
jgi:hypothetical protein